MHIASRKVNYLPPMDGEAGLSSEVAKSSGMSPEGQAAAARATGHLRTSIESGKHWYIALLEAIGLWTAPEEVYQGKRYSYVIGGEAFDWMALAERLCDSVNGLIPHEGRVRLLKRREAPIGLTATEFKKLVGAPKYRALLNYWYGVNVEAGLVRAVEGAIQKERLAAGLAHPRDMREEAFTRVYDSSRLDLLKTFNKERGAKGDGDPTEAEPKEFTYWLFKYRLAKHDKARIASDTKRGIDEMKRAGVSGPLPTNST